eukprot:63132_1
MANAFFFFNPSKPKSSMATANQLSYNKLYKIVSKLPKTELHLHLDGSLNCSFMIDSANNKGIKLPKIDDPQQLRDLLMKEKTLRRKNSNISVISQYILSKYASSSNWKIFDFCNQFLQTKHDLFNATKQLIIDLAINHNTWVIEVRFCPTLHILDGLNESEVVQSVINGYKDGVSYMKTTKNIDIKGGIIICILRSFDQKHWFNMFDLTVKYLNKGVVGMDIAGNEADFPLHIFEQSTPNLLEKCVEMKVPMTIHAGEFPVIAKTNNNIEIALKYSDVVKRIGHGLTLQFDENLMYKVEKSGIGIECCLTSNVGGGKKCKNYKLHPIKLMRKFGINCCLNSDNVLLSGDEKVVAHPTNEIVKYIMELGADWKEVKQVLMNGARLSFDKTIDDKWLNRFEMEIDSVIKSIGNENCLSYNGPGGGQRYSKL